MPQGKVINVWERQFIVRLKIYFGQVAQAAAPDRET